MMVISLKKNDDFYIGDMQFVVSDVYEEASFQVTHVATGKTFNIVRDRNTEVLPNVRIAAGDKPQQSIARVLIDAPRHVPIARGENFRNPTGKFVGKAGVAG